MSQEKLNELDILYLKKDWLREIDYENFVREFASNKAIKMNFTKII